MEQRLGDKHIGVFEHKNYEKSNSRSYSGIKKCNKIVQIQMLKVGPSSLKSLDRNIIMIFNLKGK